VSVRWLALDIGAERVGLAISDSGERVVTPVGVVPFRSAADLVERIGRFVAEREVDAVVVGVPRTRGGASRGERRVQRVLRELRGRLAVSIEEETEVGTTRAAEQSLRDAGVPRRRWALLADGVAAQFILEAHLAARRDRHEGDRAVDLADDEC